MVHVQEPVAHDLLGAGWKHQAASRSRGTSGMSTSSPTWPQQELRWHHKAAQEAPTCRITRVGAKHFRILVLRRLQLPLPLTVRHGSQARRCRFGECGGALAEKKAGCTALNGREVISTAERRKKQWCPELVGPGLVSWCWPGGGRWSSTTQRLVSSPVPYPSLGERVALASTSRAGLATSLGLVVVMCRRPSCGKQSLGTSRSLQGPHMKSSGTLCSRVWRLDTCFPVHCAHHDARNLG